MRKFGLFLLARISLLLHDRLVGHREKSSLSIPFLMCKSHEGPLTLTIVPVTASTSSSGTLSTLSSISATFVGSLVKNWRNIGRYGSKSFGYLVRFFAPRESNSTVGALPLLTPSRIRIPAVRMPSCLQCQPLPNHGREFQKPF